MSNDTTMRAVHQDTLGEPDVLAVVDLDPRNDLVSATESLSLGS